METELLGIVERLAESKAEKRDLLNKIEWERGRFELVKSPLEELKACGCLGIVLWCPCCCPVYRSVFKLI